MPPSETSFSSDPQNNPLNPSMNSQDIVFKLVELIETGQIDKSRLALYLDKARPPRKRGRKKLETKGLQPRNETVICRLTKEEKDQLMRFVHLKNLSVSDFLRQVLMEHLETHQIQKAETV